MNIEEYISSGVLESYALGQLSDSERLAVEQNLEKYPALLAELRRIEDAQEILLMKAAVPPPLHLKNKIFKDIAATRTIPLQPARTNFLRFAVAASLLVAIGSLYLAFIYRQRWQTSQQELVAINNQNRRIAEDYNRVNQEVDKIRRDVDILANPDFKRVALAGTTNSPESRATVYWNDKTTEVYLSLQNMQDLTGQQQYQLWAIIDGKPVDAGTFDGNLAGLLKMKNVVPGAIKFAVTVEPAGGSTAPTLETMQVIGDVPKG